MPPHLLSEMMQTAVDRFANYMWGDEWYQISLEVRRELEAEQQRTVALPHRDGFAVYTRNLIVALSDPVAHTRIYPRGNARLDPVTCQGGGLGSAIYFPTHVLHAAPVLAGRVVLAVRLYPDPVNGDKPSRMLQDEADKVEAY